MNNFFYTTIENQVYANGSKGLLYYHYDDINQALAKLYTILASAAVSELPYHAGCIIRSDGMLLENHVFDRRDTIEIVAPE